MRASRAMTEAEPAAQNGLATLERRFALRCPISLQRACSENAKEIKREAQYEQRYCTAVVRHQSEYRFD